MDLLLREIVGGHRLKFLTVYSHPSHGTLASRTSQQYDGTVHKAKEEDY